MKSIIKKNFRILLQKKNLNFVQKKFNATQASAESLNAERAKERLLNSVTKGKQPIKDGEYRVGKKMVLENGIDVEIRKLLRPEVLKSLDKNEDQILKKKINFCGESLAIKLNNGAVTMIDSLNNKNIFGVIGAQLKDPWEYYWYNVKKNGVDAEKWLTSLNEIYSDQNHMVVDICLRTYYAYRGSFNAPTTSQVNVLLKFKAEEVKLYDFGLWFDRIGRCNPNFTVDKESWENAGKLMANFGAEDIMEALLANIYHPSIKKPRAIREEDLNKMKEIAAGFKGEDYMSWLSNDTATPKNVIQVQQNIDAGKLKIELSRPKSIQPPFDRVGIIQEESTSIEN